MIESDATCLHSNLQQHEDVHTGCNNSPLRKAAANARYLISDTVEHPHPSGHKASGQKDSTVRQFEAMVGVDDRGTYLKRKIELDKF